MNRIPELIETQNLIIKKQAEVIDSLFLLLLEHVDASELDGLGEVEKINQVAKLKESIDKFNNYGELSYGNDYISNNKRRCSNHCMSYYTEQTGNKT